MYSIRKGILTFDRCEYTKLYQWSSDYGIYTISGFFFEDSRMVKRLNGKTVYFNDVVGKDTIVECGIYTYEFTVFNVSQNTLDELYDISGQCIAGRNPIWQYLGCEREKVVEYDTSDITMRYGCQGLIINVLVNEGLISRK